MKHSPRKGLRMAIRRHFPLTSISSTERLDPLAGSLRSVQAVCLLTEAGFGSMCLFLEHLQVIDMPEHNPGQMGGTMRLGKRRTLFQTKNSVMSKSGLPPAQPAGRTSRCYSQAGIYSFVLTWEVLYFFPSDTP